MHAVASSSSAPCRGVAFSWHDLAPSTRRIAILWLSMAVAVTIRTLVQPEKHTVFPIFQMGSLHWWDNLSLYARYGELDYFRYSPLFAILITPLALLGPCIGGILWSWLSIGALVGGLVAIERFVLPGIRAGKQREWFHILALLCSLRGIWNLQSNPLIVGLLLIGVVEIARQRWSIAALCLAGTVALKLTALPLLLLLCALWPRKLILRVLAVLIITATIPFLTRSPTVVVAQYQQWQAQMTELAQERWPGFRDAWTIVTVLRQSAIPDLKAPLTVGWYRYLQMGTGFLVLLWSLWLKRRTDSIPWLLTGTMAIGTAWLMVFGPATEHPTYVFMAPWLAWAILHAQPQKKWLIHTSAVLILFLGWSAVTAKFWPIAPWLILALPLGTLCFAAWCLLTVPE